MPLRQKLTCLLTLLPVLAVLTPVSAQGPNTDLPTPSSQDSSTGPIAADVNGEMRGMWVVRESMRSPQSVHQVVVTATKYHLNAIFVQVRGRGDAWYNSPYEPRAEQLSNQPRDFDPLEQIVREGHAAGLQVHAWMNTFLTWSSTRAPYSPNHLWNAHKDWFARDRNGNCSPRETNRCEGVFLQPSNPEVQKHLLNVYTDVATRYDVDGIHFDYCRYPGTDYDFSRSTLNRFRDYMVTQIADTEKERFDKRLGSDHLAYVHAFGKEWADWRRAQITGLVARISQTVKAAKPWMQVTAAVFPNANDAYNDKGQDWRGWIQAGYLDAVALMAYGYDTQTVLHQTREAVVIAGEKHVYTGIGAWRLDAHDVAHKIAEIRKTGAAGVNLFSYDGVHSRAHYLDTLARGVFASRSAPRRMRWLPDRSASASRSGTSPLDTPSKTPDSKQDKVGTDAGERR